MPRAAKERIDAEVFKRMYEAQHSKIEPDDPQLTLRPNM